jgi:GNAT superfamily N-acetyltransferase
MRRMVRELLAGESGAATAALLELRPHVGSAGELVARVDEQRDEGYRLAGSFEAGDEQAAAAAGFRVVRNLVSGRHLYVDDLVTREALRGRGHADALMAWVEDEARRQGCAFLELDSGLGPRRADAHRLYFRRRLQITAFHFQRALD